MSTSDEPPLVVDFRLHLIAGVKPVFSHVTPVSPGRIPSVGVSYTGRVILHTVLFSERLHRPPVFSSLLPIATGVVGVRSFLRPAQGVRCTTRHTCGGSSSDHSSVWQPLSNGFVSRPPVSTGVSLGLGTVVTVHIDIGVYVSSFS